MNMNMNMDDFEFDCEWPPVWVEDKHEFSYTDINRCGLGTVYDYIKEYTLNGTNYPNMTVAREAWYASDATCLRCRYEIHTVIVPCRASCQFPGVGILFQRVLHGGQITLCRFV